MALLKGNEIWKNHPSYNNYAVSNIGRVKNNLNNNILKKRKNKDGYLHAVLYKGGLPYTCKVHRLVLETFVGPCPEGHECNHKEGNKENNELENLEWVTKSQNMKHAFEIGLKNSPNKGKFGSQNSNSKLKEGEVWLIKKLLSYKIKQMVIAQMFKVHKSTICHINNGYIWANL
jgi:hypothetical protein